MPRAGPAFEANMSLWSCLSFVFLLSCVSLALISF
uniref:Uncharacterized protein n=1 Tax=Anguilla anguilla TaxID=7936 RepID=A0A0E9SV06_ANGAN